MLVHRQYFKNTHTNKIGATLIKILITDIKNKHILKLLNDTIIIEEILTI